MLMTILEENKPLLLRVMDIINLKLGGQKAERLHMIL